MRYDMRGTFGWRVNRLSDGPTGLEIFGSAGFYVFALFFLVFGTGMLLYANWIPPRMAGWVPVSSVVCGIVFLGVGSLSTGQLIYRARLRRALATTGVTTESTVIDRWTLQIGKGTASAIRFRFTTASGPVEGVACDDTTLVSRIKIGDLLPLRYDPANPRRLLIDPVPKR
jgi:hypothetical protein